MNRLTFRQLATIGAMAWALGAGSCAPTRVLTGPPAPPPIRPRSDPAEGSEPSVIIGRVIEAHNAERARRKLGPLVSAPALETAAAEHARDMAGRGRMSHRGKDGSSPFDRIHRAGYTYQAAAENVAYGFDGVESVMDGWMRSPGHRRNILGPFTEIGVGRATGKDGLAYWSVTFGTPRTP